MAKEVKEKAEYGGLLVGGGTLVGLGIGLLVGNAGAGLFIGVGLGLLAWAGLGIKTAK